MTEQPPICVLSHLRKPRVSVFKRTNMTAVLVSLGLLTWLLIGVSGTYAQDSNCNPNYSGCLSNSAYDLDCGEVKKSVKVTGSDVFGLDRDGDGVGCESYGSPIEGWLLVSGAGAAASYFGYQYYDKRRKEKVHQERLIKRAATLASNRERGYICPLCNSTLEIKHGRFGSFYGCISYPKCKFTQKLKD